MDDDGFPFENDPKDNPAFDIGYSFFSILSELSSLKNDRPNKRALVIINTVTKLIKSLSVDDFLSE